MVNILLAKLCPCFNDVTRRLSMWWDVCLVFQLRIPVSRLHALTPVIHCLMAFTNVSVLWVINWKMETLTTVRTLMSVRMRVMYVIRNVEILKDLINVGVDQGTKQSIRLNARTLMSVPTAVMTVNRFVWTPSALSCVLVTILTDLDQTASTAWIILSVSLTMITRVMSHTWFVLMTLVTITVSAPVALIMMVTDVRM